jgi:hypothetical protein
MVWKRLMLASYVTEHVVLDRTLHGDGLAVLILDSSVSAITGSTCHLLTKFLVQFGQSLVLFGLLRLRLRR